ncbi:MAG: NAD-dependent epimerase/dehydratase family protein [Thermodesulfobacteriota bacterium]
MKRILVTGATGFVGRSFCARLVEERLPFRRAVRIADRTDRDTIAVGDIDGRTDWGRALAGVSHVVHLAARVHVMGGEGEEMLAAYRQVNVDGTCHLAVQAARAGVRRFVFVSTIKVNGEETHATPFRADDLPAPADAYAVSKLEAEQGLMRIAGEGTMEVVIVRLPLVYGKGAGGNFGRLLRLVDSGLPLPFAGITNQRSLLGVDNLCHLLTLCLIHPAAANRLFLAADNEDVSTPELIRLLAKARGVPARLFSVPALLLVLVAGLAGRKGELRRLTGDLRVDAAATRTTLGWQPPLTLTEGIRRAVS